MATESKKVRRDAFVKSVRPNPKSTEDLVLLQGYIGDSDLAGHVRVYSDPALSDFIELPEQDILYYDPVSTEEDPLGGSRLWVKQTTVFTAGDPRHANRVKSSFLEGDIVRAFSDAREIPTVAQPAFRRLTQPVLCQIPLRTIAVCASGRISVCFCQVDRSINPANCPSGTCPPPRTFGFPCESYPARCPVSQGCPSGFNCTFNCTFVCPRLGIPTFYNPTCNVITCDPRFSLWGCTTIAFDFKQQTPTSPEAIHSGYTGGFNPYDTANYGY